VLVPPFEQVIASVLGFMASAKNPIGDSIGGDVIDVDQARRNSTWLDHTLTRDRPHRDLIERDHALT
jgi:hypothetical protein